LLKLTFAPVAVARRATPTGWAMGWSTVMMSVVRRASVSAHVVPTEMVTVRGRITSGPLMVGMMMMSVVTMIVVAHSAAEE
jgi:hypothetical protein